MDLGVRGKNYLIVGGTSGLGLATATTMASEGANLVVAGRDLDKATAVATSLGAEGRTVLGRRADVTSTDDVEQLVEGTVDDLGSLDGIAVLTGTIGHDPIDIDDAAWEAVFNDVYLGTVRAVRAALPHLTVNGGTIVTTAAYSIRSPDIQRLPYASMKSSVATFTKGIARTYGAQGVRANCVCPGAIETEPMQALRAQLAEVRGYPLDEAIERVMVEEWKLDVALGRLGRPEEVGELMTFLLSDRAAYLTGALINIDGGTHF